MEMLKIGLVGCGGMMGAHVADTNKLKTARIVAVCDIIKKNAEAVVEVLGDGVKVYSDYRDMVDDIDAVLVALPHDLHYECGLWFARHKKHVLMEKPLCNDEEECRRLIKACKEEGVTLMCAYPVPHYPAVRRLKELVDSGKYGKVIQMSVWTEQYTKGASEFGWGKSARLGGGQFFSHGCHYIDLLLRFLGKPIKGYHIGNNIGHPFMLKEATSAVVLQFEGGTIGYHGASWCARGSRLGWSIQILTESGAMLEYHKSEEPEIRIYDNDPSINKHEIDKYEVIWKQKATNPTRWYKYLNLQMEHFAECVRENKTPITDGESALKSLQVIWELYDAEKRNYIPDLTPYAYTEDDNARYAEYIKKMNEVEAEYDFSGKIETLSGMDKMNH